MPVAVTSPIKSLAVDAPAAARAGRRWWSASRRGELLLLFLFAVLCFATSIGNDYSFDDVHIVQLNPGAHSVAHWREAFRHEYWHPWGQGRGLYRPITILSFAVHWALQPNFPQAYHFANVLLHALVVLLVYGLALRFLEHRWALAAAAWFAAVPTHVEVVAGLVGRAELLATFFALAALLLALRSHGARDARTRLLLAAAAAACTALALGSKETAITTVPAMLLLLWLAPQSDQARDSGEPGIAALRRIALSPAVIASALATAGYLVIRARVAGMFVDRVRFVENPLVEAGLLTRIRTAMLVSAQYLGALAWPFRLAPEYSYNQIPLVRSGLDPRFLVAAALLGAAAAILWRRRRSRAVMFGTLFALIAYLPVSNLLVLIGTIRAERLLYLPSVGVAIVAGCWCEHVWKTISHASRGGLRNAGAWLAAAGAVVLLTYATTDAHEGTLWRDNATLFAAAVRRTPDCAKTHVSYAGALEHEKRLDDAEREFRRALAIYTRFSEAASGLGMVYEDRKNFQAAIDWYKRAFELTPGESNFLKLSDLELAHGRPNDILLESRHLLHAPSPAALINIGLAAIQAGDPRGALELVRGPAERTSDKPQLIIVYARALEATGNKAEAERQFRRAHQLAMAHLHDTPVEERDWPTMVIE